MAQKLFYIFDRAWHKAFFAFGRYHALSKNLLRTDEDKTTLDRLSSFFQKIFPIQPPGHNPRILKYWSEITTKLGLPHGALCRLHAPHKTMEFIGLFDYGLDDTYYITAYKNPDDALLATSQAQFMQAHFSAFFLIAQAIESTTHCVLSHALKNNANASYQALYDKGYEAHLSLYKKHHLEQKNIDSFLILDMPMLFEKYGVKTTWDTAYHHLETLDAISFVPNHGNFIPRNAFKTSDQSIALLAYERCGWHVPFYDLFHLTTDMMPKGRALFPDRLITQITQDTKIDHERVLTWFMLYLLDQLYFLLDDYINHDIRSASLKTTINRKLSLLRYTSGLLNKN